MNHKGNKHTEEAKEKMRNSAHRKSHCIRGHERTPENVSHRGCILCAAFCKRLRYVKKPRKKFCVNGHIRMLSGLDSSRGCKLCRKQRYDAWRKAHPELANASSKKYNRANPEKCRALQHKRRARVLGNGGSFTDAQWLGLKHLYGDRCLGCGRTEAVLKALGLCLTPDHVLPVARGGSSDIGNIQPLCHGKNGCNNHKGIKYVDYRPKGNSKKAGYYEF